MFKTLWFLFIAAVIAGAITWLLENNGSIVINWLGYEVQTDILTAILLTIFFALVIFVIAYISVKIRSIRLPKFSQFFHKKHAE